jgi:hypothetical protein
MKAWSVTDPYTEQKRNVSGNNVRMHRELHKRTVLLES